MLSCQHHINRWHDKEGEKGADSDIRGNSGWTMGNQLQRLINRSQDGSEAKESLERIRDELIKRGGKWPPLPVSK